MVAGGHGHGIVNGDPSESLIAIAADSDGDIRHGRAPALAGHWQDRRAGHCGGDNLKDMLAECRANGVPCADTVTATTEELLRRRRCEWERASESFVDLLRVARADAPPVTQAGTRACQAEPLLQGPFKFFPGSRRISSCRGWPCGPWCRLVTVVSRVLLDFSGSGLIEPRGP
eukprot:1995781-Rhodomonas_salina.1